MDDRMVRWMHVRLQGSAAASSEEIMGAPIRRAPFFGRHRVLCGRRLSLLKVRTAGPSHTGRTASRRDLLLTVNPDYLPAIHIGLTSNRALGVPAIGSRDQPLNERRNVKSRSLRDAVRPVWDVSL